MCTKDISLKAASADAFYYPPEWNPSRGSLDQFQQRRGFEHFFGKQRTKNLSRGILQIRFEMPFKVQCLRCMTFIGQGTRYDADKKKVGKYLSSPLYEFQMRCGVIVDPAVSADHSAHCNQRFVIRTDPKNDDYELAEGLRRVAQTWDHQDSETIPLVDPETRRQMNLDPMFRAEKIIRDKEKEKSNKQRLEDLEDMQADREDAYSLNCLLRRGNRARRKEEKAKEERERLEGPKNFALPLLPESAEDAAAARRIPFRTDHDALELSARRAAARAAPVLPSPRQPPAKDALELSARRAAARAPPLLPSPRQPPAKRPRSSASARPAVPATTASETQRLAAKRRRLAGHARMAQISVVARA